MISFDADWFAVCAYPSGDKLDIPGRPLAYAGRVRDVIAQPGQTLRCVVLTTLELSIAMQYTRSAINGYIWRDIIPRPVFVANMTGVGRRACYSGPAYTLPEAEALADFFTLRRQYFKGRDRSENQYWPEFAMHRETMLHKIAYARQQLREAPL